MNFAIITAAGVGSRMKLPIPKQYYQVNGKPLIVYTLEAFQKCEEIDGICLIISEQYEPEIKKLLKTYDLSKVRWIAYGGESNQMSINNGLAMLDGKINDNDIVLVHDGIRPLVTADIIIDCIEVAKKNGNAIAAVPCNEAMLFTKDKCISNKSIDRNNIMKTQTPHAMAFLDMKNLMKKTIQRGQKESVAICTMLIEDGQTVFFSKGNNLNFKLTQPEDISLFKGILAMKIFENN